VTSDHASVSDAVQRYSSSDFAHLCAESFARADEMLIDALPRNTRRAYQNSLRLWCLWYRLRFWGDVTVTRLSFGGSAVPARLHCASIG
jgi:hypothetical protein